MIPKPLQSIERLTVALHAGQPIPEDVATWLLHGVEKFRKSNGRISLCRCLGLVGQGKLSYARQLLQAERDKYLKLAWENVSLADIADWERSKRLADAAQNFKTSLWPRWRRQAEPPSGTDAVKENLYYAYRVGIPVPTSPRHIHRLVTRNMAF